MSVQVERAVLVTELDRWVGGVTILGSLEWVEGQICWYICVWYRTWRRSFPYFYELKSYQGWIKSEINTARWDYCCFLQQDLISGFRAPMSICVPWWFKGFYSSSFSSTNCLSSATYYHLPNHHDLWKSWIWSYFARRSRIESAICNFMVRVKIVTHDILLTVWLAQKNK